MQIHAARYPRSQDAGLTDSQQERVDSSSKGAGGVNTVYLEGIAIPREPQRKGKGTSGLCILSPYGEFLPPIPSKLL